jgi:hypothetical protein
VGEQRAAVYVADRVEPVRAPDPHAVVDAQVPARLEPDRLEPEVVGGRSPSDRDEQLVGGQALSAFELDEHLPPVPLDGDRL